MRRGLRTKHRKSLLAELTDRALGRAELLIRPQSRLPLVVARYPRGSVWFASALRSALCSTFSLLPKSLRRGYEEVLEKVPPLVVADLRRSNVCSCLGHHHPQGTQGNLAKRLSDDTGQEVGEIDLAVEAIRKWEPLPLSGLAAAERAYAADHESRGRVEETRFQLALLAVFLHELEHLAFPSRGEVIVRRHSDEFYRAAVTSFLARDFGVAFGISS